jgi:3-oxoacyl-[acyl-carrier protein] reductase
LGRETALAFARRGWDVAVNCIRSVDAARAVAAEVRDCGVEAAVFKADVADLAAREALIASVVERFGRLDCLVNNAAIALDHPLARFPERDWNAVVATDLTGPMDLARRAAAAMGPGGSIVNVISICGLWGCGGAAAYSAAKAGLAGFTRGLAAELRPRGVRVNAVAPGYMPTDMGNAAPRMREAARARHAMGVLSAPAGAAAFIVQLADMPSVGGQAFLLDGRIR